MNDDLGWRALGVRLDAMSPRLSTGAERNGERDCGRRVLRHLLRAVRAAVPTRVAPAPRSGATALFVLASALAPIFPAQAASAAKPAQARPEARARAADGPHPIWLFGPDRPIVPPGRFVPSLAPPLAPDGAVPGASAAGTAMLCTLEATPACAVDPLTYRAAASRKACEALVSAHVQKAFAYRQCLDAEMTRATRSVNEAIRRLKCGRPKLDGCD